MHAVAESGIAAHWVYKTGDSVTNAAQKRARQWLKELLDMQKQSGDSIEFLENVKVDLFPKEVYVFTPAGDIMPLPRGATPVDLAYAVHTDVGNTCIATKIDGRYAPLSTILATGQNVEIVTAPWGRPSANWLNYVVTGKARSNIRNYLKHLRSGEATELGKRLLTQALASESLSLEDVPKERIETLVKEFSLQGFDDLLEEIGLGKRIAPLVALRLLPHRGNGEDPGSKTRAHRRLTSNRCTSRGRRVWWSISANAVGRSRGIASSDSSAPGVVSLSTRLRVKTLPISPTGPRNGWMSPGNRISTANFRWKFVRK
jgi:(p)ppGpp synthase/HD superfamily hydrolase